MKIEAFGYSFCVEDNWLKETITIPFSKAGCHYNFKKDSKDVIIVRISEINPSIEEKVFRFSKMDQWNGSLNPKTKGLKISSKGAEMIVPFLALR